MSRLTDLLRRVEQQNPALGKDLSREIEALSSRRAFGLNFERHLPESVELPGRRIRRGDKVRFRPARGEPEKGLDDRLWRVSRIEGRGQERTAHLVEYHPDGEPATAARKTDDLVVVAEFRDPIYPGLRSTGTVERGSDKPFHTVINAENYHALEALMFAYEGKVDCIYIDPPYNTGARDWKYNNDYVDGEDAYRHSKWLAMMERRLKLAKRLLNPEDSVLIVTIDEREAHRLALLLEQIFPSARMQTVSSVINPKGTSRTAEFSRTDEYVLFVMLGNAAPTAEPEEEGVAGRPVDWGTLRRRDLSSVRHTRPAQFYPIYVEIDSKKIVEIGEPLPHEQDRSTVPSREGHEVVFPVRPDGTEMNWGVTGPALRSRLERGFVRVGKHEPDAPQKFVISYLKTGPIRDIEEGRAEIVSRGVNGNVEARYKSIRTKLPTTNWQRRSHDAERHGSILLRKLLPGRRFPFPKSLYAVEDCLRFFVSDKPNTVVLDFFAGSGTTAHAVMRLNRQDGGSRRSIMVTNNEVGEDEAKALRKEGHRPGDPEWEAMGIAEYITKPRITAAITGQTPEDEPIKGDYKFTDEFPMADGFEENVEFFDLTYQDPTRVRHDLAFSAIAPLLWMRAGSTGRRIDKPTNTFDIAETYAVLFTIDAAAAFVDAIGSRDRLRIAYIVTDDEAQYQSIAAELPRRIETVRLYEAYLRTFEINTGEA